MLTRTGHAGKDRRSRRRRQTSSSCSSDRSCSGDTSSLTLSPPPLLASSESSGQLYWDISLDPDLLQTIAHFYPEWFSSAMAEPAAAEPSLGSPRAVVDDASIQKAMDKNKESLKVKLLLRRPIGQLVEQGILPPLKATPEFYERSKKLERARMEDYLKRQIQRRPDRQSLIEQHILEDSFVSPSLQGAERQLKKVRLADDLNDRLSHRPGPLELVKGNILLADERLAQAIKEGAIQFKATCEGEPVKHPPPLFHLEDPESSSDGTRSPPQDLSDASVTSFSPVDAHAAVPSCHFADASPVPVTSSGLLISSPAPCSSASTVLQPQSICITSCGPSLQPVASGKLTAPTAVTFSIAAPTLTATAAATTLSSPSPPPALLSGETSSALRSSFTPGSLLATKSDPSSLAAKSRKKCKSKVQPKTRTIKFHEYKGPPSAQKSGPASVAASPSESSYELLLKQQQLFLQWQLEWQQKYPHIIMPAAAQKQLQEQSQQDVRSGGANAHQTVLISSGKSAMAEAAAAAAATAPKHNANQSNEVVHNTLSNNNTPGISHKNNTSLPAPATPAATPKLISRLEDLKVSDLKVQLKKRSLPVSGSKPQLLERLKPFTSEVLAALRASAAAAAALDPSDSPKSSDSPSPSSNNSSECHAQGVMDAGGECAPEVVAAGEVAMDVGDVLQGSHSNVSPLFTTTSESVSLSTTPRLINNGFIINKDMIKLHPEPLESQQQQGGKQAAAQYPVQQGQQQQQFQLQLQYPIFQSQGPSIAIPLASLGAPQFQVITTQNQSSPHLTTTASHPADSATPHRRKSSTSNQMDQSRPSSAAVKASLAAFLQNQAAQQQTNLMSEHFVTGDLSYPHVVLLPADQSLVTKQQRAHSFSVPVDTTCHLANQSRAGSLPSFPIPARRLEKSAASASRPPPPNYEEATKVTATSTKPAKRTSKKNMKSQALEDVLEILVKSGELPASAADEPETPTTPSCKSSSHPGHMFSDKADTHQHRLFGRLVKEEVKPEPLPCHNSDAALDLDLILNLQSLEEPMDFGTDPDRNAMPWQQLHTAPIQKQGSSSSGERRALPADPNCDMSLGWMEVSPSDANDWIAELNLAVENDNKLTDHRSREVPSNDFSHCLSNYSQRNSLSMDRRSLFRPNLSPVTIASSCSAKDHDPILPNNMVGTVSTTEPLLDLFFDDSDMRAHELGVWDRLDFAA